MFELDFVQIGLGYFVGLCAAYFVRDFVFPRK
jgi:multisubunit Na+/H+ antiporter MnhE subunit